MRYNDNWYKNKAKICELMKLFIILIVIAAIIVVGCLSNQTIFKKSNGQLILKIMATEREKTSKAM
jgi:uncharacterized protein YcfL